VLVTDRGMYADYRGDHLIEKVLLKLELAVPRGPANGNRAESWRTRLLNQRETRKALRFVGQKLLPESMRQALLPLHRAAMGESAPLDWRKTHVYAMPTVGNSHLRVNLAGREPLGVVTPGAEFQAVVAQTAAQLRELINPATGERAVQEIYFPSKQFAGPRSSELPDIAVVWNPNSPITALNSSAIGTISGKSTEGRTGNHRPDGFALFSGAAYSGHRNVMNGDPRQIAPTILKHFGVTPPAYYEKQSIALNEAGRSLKMSA
jgi:predicted AlkP superfamily phosphohydrolase/phosphomutase